MERIEKFPLKKREQVKTIFAWLVSAKRPLRAVEIKQAIMIQAHDTSVDTQDKLLLGIKELCGCIVEEKEERVMFVHYSAKE